MGKEESSYPIVESRQELMISPTSHANPTLRTAHFLKPSINSNPQVLFKLSSLSQPSLLPSFDPQNWPFTVNFNGWRHPLKQWDLWVSKMASLHGPTWKKAGIHDSIFNSIYPIHKATGLVLGVAERWCPDTNSFIFSWGEATLTLEDMMIAGYSVLGSPVFEPLHTVELMGIQQNLVRARLELIRSSSKKAVHNTWLKIFMNSGSEIEHEAFLSLWLSRFVLPTSFDVVCDCVFPIAIHLARGTRIALAPAVLATIYRDLSLLKRKIVALSNNYIDNGDEKLSVTIWSPFQLVLVWVWERFVNLCPEPNLIKNGEPRLARWNNLKCKTEDVRLLLDSSRENFIWRPYTKTMENWNMPKFYREKEMWVSQNCALDEEIMSFIRCLRVSELIGLDCREQYLPHRVVRQFGMDQDLPCFVARSSGSCDDAWSFYTRPISDAKCHIPSCLFESDVTARYLEWWNRSVSVQHEEKISEITPQVLKENEKGQNSQQSLGRLKVKKALLVPHQEKISKIIPNVLKEKKVQKLATSSQRSSKTLNEKKAADKLNRLRISTKSSRRMKKAKTISSFMITPKISDRTKEGDIFISSFKITPKVSNITKGGDIPKISPNNASENKEADAGCSYHSKSLLRILKRKKGSKAMDALGNPVKQTKTLAKSSKANNEENSDYMKILAETNNLLVPPGFPPKYDRVEIRVPAEEDNQTIAEMLKCTNNRQCAGGKNVSGKPESHSSPVADNEATKTSVVATSVARTLQRKTNEKGNDGDSKISTLPIDIAALKVLSAVMSVEKAKHGETTEDSQYGSYYYNVLHQFGQSQTCTSFIAGNKMLKNSELREAELAEKVTKREGLQQNDYGSGNAAHRRSDKYSLKSPEFTMLEDRIGRLEQRIAKRLAVLCGEKHGA